FIPSGIPANNPEDGKSIANDSLITLPVLEQLRKSCFDCHSNEVDLPWYSKMAPSSWLLADHINEGKAHLNFSEWEGYSNREKIGLLDDIRDEVSSGEMPLKSYLLIHRNAKPGPEGSAAILKWTEEATARILE
ncbi:cytochrome C, partial [bacterium]|nr:cytochrome C [bacterium]